VLADLVLKAEILDRIAQRQPEALPAELEEFRSLVRNAVGDMRRFMFDLRPDSLDDLGLVATMKRFASEYQDRTGITCRFNVNGEDRRVGPVLEEAIFRIIQEALTNVQKHAEAKTAEVTLAIQPGVITARIRDDGSGFEVGSPPSGGRQQLGLLGMRERAEALGGRIEVRSEAGKGTEIEVEFRTEPQA
jgi:two-component system sensor histidine kinase DegS